MIEYYSLYTAHGRLLAADRAAGWLCSVTPDADRAKYPLLLAIAPSLRPTTLFLTTNDVSPFPISVRPRPFKSPLLPFFIERDQTATSVALRFPDGMRYLSAGPGQPGTPSQVAANAETRRAWENFDTKAVTAAKIAPVILTLAKTLDHLFDGTPIAEALLRLIQDAPSPNVQHVLQAISPLLDLDDWNHIGAALAKESGHIAEFSRQIPDDIWATVGLPTLQNWLVRREDATWNRSQDDKGVAQGAAPVDLQSHKLVLPESLDFLAKAGALGSYASFGHACNAAARRLVKPSRALCVLATARNEGLYFIEWIAYHRLAGAEAIFIYSNDNDDGSDALLSALADAGVITWIQSRLSAGGSAQYKAYGHALSLLPDILDYRWAVIIDLDEFLVFDPDRFGSILDFLSRQEVCDADAICINCLGAAPNKDGIWRDAPLTRRFSVPKRPVNPHVKSIIRPGVFIHSQPHFPRTDERLRPVFVNSSGRRHTYGKNAQKAGLQPHEWPAMSDEPDTTFASVNHYFFKSAEEFLWKASRNRGDHPTEVGISQNQKLLPFFKAFLEHRTQNPTEVDDRVIRCTPALEAEMMWLRSIRGVAEAEAKVQVAFRARMREVVNFYRNPPPVLVSDATAHIVALATEGIPRDGS